MTDGHSFDRRTQEPDPPLHTHYHLRLLSKVHEGQFSSEVRRSLWSIYKFTSELTSNSYAVFFTCSAPSSSHGRSRCRSQMPIPASANRRGFWDPEDSEWS